MVQQRQAPSFNFSWLVVGSKKVKTMFLDPTGAQEIIFVCSLDSSLSRALNLQLSTQIFKELSLRSLSALWQHSFISLLALSQN